MSFAEPAKHPRWNVVLALLQRALVFLRHVGSCSWLLCGIVMKETARQSRLRVAFPCHLP